MSYSYELNLEAAAAVRACGVWLQEAIFDELDLIAADPSKLVLHGVRQWGVHDFEREHEGRRYTVFIAVRPDHRRRVLNVFRVGLHAEPTPPGD